MDTRKEQAERHRAEHADLMQKQAQEHRAMVERHDAEHAALKAQAAEALEAFRTLGAA